MSAYADIFEASSVVWPLTFVLIALFILKKVEAQVNPIVTGVVASLADQSKKNAMAWAMAGMIGLSASMQALIDVTHTLGGMTGSISWWFYIEASARVAGPGLIAVIALLRPAPAQGTTNPPFPKP